MDTQVYRASVAGIIVNQNKEFLLTQLNISKKEEYDFVKGGMDIGENEIETLNREIKEELGKNIDFEIIQRSDVFIIYEWPEDLKKNSGYRGQARVSYWIFYKGGNIKLAKKELKKANWVAEENVKEMLKKGHFPDLILENIWKEWLQIKKQKAHLFN